jgi:hypothetical protein
MSLSPVTFSSPGKMQTDTSPTQVICLQYNGLPYELFMEIFAEFDFSFDQLNISRLTCRSWKLAVDDPAVGKRFFSKFPFYPPIMEGGWMKIYCYWIRFANYYFLVDSSSSMSGTDDEEATRYARALNKVEMRAREMFPFAARGIRLVTFNDRFEEEVIQQSDKLGESITALKQKRPRGSTDFTSLSETILHRSGISSENQTSAAVATHIVLHSDFDVSFKDYVPLFEKVFQRPDAFTLSVTQYGATSNGNEFMKKVFKFSEEKEEQDDGEKARKRPREESPEFQIIFPELQERDKKKPRKR